MPVPCAGGGGGGGAARGRAEFITSLFTGRRTALGGAAPVNVKIRSTKHFPPPFPPVGVVFLPGAVKSPWLGRSDPSHAEVLT